nr:MAG TPA: hypothetical protein [Caudoviricetes sp.]
MFTFLWLLFYVIFTSPNSFKVFIFKSVATYTFYTFTVLTVDNYIS